MPTLFKAIGYTLGTLLAVFVLIVLRHQHRSDSPEFAFIVLFGFACCVFGLFCWLRSICDLWPRTYWVAIFKRAEETHFFRLPFPTSDGRFYVYEGSPSKRQTVFPDAVLKYCTGATLTRSCLWDQTGESTKFYRVKARLGLDRFAVIDKQGSRLSLGHIGHTVRTLVEAGDIPSVYKKWLDSAGCQRYLTGMKAEREQWRGRAEGLLTTIQCCIKLLAEQSVLRRNVSAEALKEVLTRSLTSAGQEINLSAEAQRTGQYVRFEEGFLRLLDQLTQIRKNRQTRPPGSGD
ncbi:MAG: hypothetical protein V1846_02110 [Candidatus Komeilibacteria bacterium]